MKAKQLFICFSKAIVLSLARLLTYCAAITRAAQFIGRNAANFLLALAGAQGGYGLFFLFLGANFFSSLSPSSLLLPSLTSCLRA